MLTDTHPDAERTQRDLLRRASAAERISLMRSLSTSLLWASRQSLREAHPEWSERELGIRWVELQYGRTLAAELRDFFEKPPPCNCPNSSPL
jgi:hypothetical protein